MLGTLVGETGINAAVCGHWGAPVVLVTGDRAVCREGRELLGDGLTTVEVKEGIGRFSARSKTPREARALKANDLLYYELMRHARATKGCTRYDFGRSKAGTGVAAFKKNWGFEGVPLRYAKRVAPGETPREMNPMSPKYRLQVAVWKRLPLWLANTMGPVIAKGLG